MRIAKHFDAWSLVVIGATVGLFLAATLTTGVVHDLLLETGAFLVSVKLILMAYKSSVTALALAEKLEEIHQAVRQLDMSVPSTSPAPPVARD